MGFILESTDQLKVQVLDTIIIFFLGSLLLFFFNAMINHPRTFLVTFAGYITILVLFLTIYINKYCTSNTKNNKKNILNFMSIYTICLNLLLIFVVTNDLI